MKRLAIIPARGGSKRIERKNIRPFLGRPIIAYAIEAALGSGLFDTVMVSTDDEQIAHIARQYGAEVPFMRSAATADDHATTGAVLREVLERYDQKFDAACCVYPTAVLLGQEPLKEAYQKMEREGLDSVFAMVRYSYPPQRALVERQGKVVMQYPEYVASRSQDLEPIYHDAGQFYWFGVEQFLKTGQLWGANSSAVVLSELEVQDIDTLEDWAMAEIKYTKLYGR